VEVRVETVKSPPDGRVLLHNVSWETYERLIAEREERPVPRFFYDRGELEILSPSAEHESIGRLISSLVGELAVEWDTDVFDVGHTTFRREDLDRGFEPDCSFYFSGNAARIRGKRDMDLDVDPSPDLVVEVDVTNPSLNKLPIYARLGVREVWRYAGRQPEILVLDEMGERYEATTESRILPLLEVENLRRLVERGLTLERPTWVREVRGWARGRGAAD
jgi:Uma2 family endonuclease